MRILNKGRKNRKAFVYRLRETYLEVLKKGDKRRKRMIHGIVGICKYSRDKEHYLRVNGS